MTTILLAVHSGRNRLNCSCLGLGFLWSAFQFMHFHWCPKLPFGLWSRRWRAPKGCPCNTALQIIRLASWFCWILPWALRCLLSYFHQLCPIFLQFLPFRSLPSYLVCGARSRPASMTVHEPVSQILVLWCFVNHIRKLVRSRSSLRNCVPLWDASWRTRCLRRLMGSSSLHTRTDRAHQTRKHSGQSRQTEVCYHSCCSTWLTALCSYGGW